MIDVLLLIGGLALLLGGGDFLVRGASGLARSMGVSPLVIGLTVVAFGTSAPELTVNMMGAWRGNLDLAFGNIVGSNLANIGLILGIASCIRPLVVQSEVVVREIPMSMLAILVTGVLVLDPELRGEPAVVDRSDGLVLLLFFAVFIYYTVIGVIRGRAAKKLAASVEDVPLPVGPDRPLLDVVMVVLGLVALVGGAELTIRGAVSIARTAGVSESLIGLTLVAIGTSLPELVASAVAAWKGESDLAVGNVIGSNIFNVLLVLGTTASFRPVEISAGGRIDVIAVVVATLAVFLLCHTHDRKIVRAEGILLLIGYFAYCGWRITWEG
ncbi:MAG: calcium/sodium antiporter [Planctomycetes bacterium]|nr:calcium/sodium antiporter [Planctomycetota bacterium]